jgi:hypothetical protein
MRQSHQHFGRLAAAVLDGHGYNWTATPARREESRLQKKSASGQCLALWSCFAPGAGWLSSNFANQSLVANFQFSVLTSETCFEVHETGF